MTASEPISFEERLDRVTGGKRRQVAKGEGEERPNATAHTLEVLKPFIVAKWRTPSREPMVTLRDPNGIDSHLSLASSNASELLNLRYFQSQGKPISEATRKQVMELLAVDAKYLCEEHPVFSRIAGHEGELYVDLCEAGHLAVRITPERWSVIDSKELPVRFRRSQSALSLPAPEAGGSLDELRIVFPNSSDEDWSLVKAFLVGSFLQTGGRPFLEIVGGQGAGKSTFGRAIMALIDPNEAPMRALPRTEQDLLISVQGRALAGFDNLSGFPADIADSLCRISTGAGLSNRTLYSNSAETIFLAQLSLIWTAIEPQAIRRPDLQDRTITARLEALDDTAVVSERDLWREFETMRPRLLGALYDALAVALSRVADVQIDRLPRLADFATWVEAAAPAFGWDEGEFLDIFGASRATAAALAVDAIADRSTGA